MLIGGIFRAPGPDTYSLDERAVDRDSSRASVQYGVVGASTGAVEPERERRFNPVAL
jgi:hypothetical protein